jgi:Sulfotransferase domain
MVKPTFLGIGAQKCASTWIYEILNDHPEISVSNTKELDFFSHHYNRGYTWYERHFNKAGIARAIGEVSPSYFCDPSAPDRVEAYVPSIKMVLILRDPVQRAFSNHLHEIRKGHFVGEDLRFEAGLASNPMYLFQSRYGTHLANWLRVFPKDRLLLLVQEDILADPLAEVRRLYAFLGVDPGYRSPLLFRRSHESVGARSLALYKAWRAVGDFGRRRGLGDLVESVKKLPPVAATMTANRRDLRTQIPGMQPETEQALQRELASELMTLADLVGRHDWPWSTWHAAMAMSVERTCDVIDLRPPGERFGFRRRQRLKPTWVL